MTHVCEWSKAKEMADVAIRRAEGERGYVYADSFGNPTCGIGHKVISADGLEVGDLVNIELVNKFYKSDFEQAYRAIVRTHAQYPSDLKAERLAVLIEMAFCLGESGLNDFELMWRAIECENWAEASEQILDSRWYWNQGCQVPAIKDRIERLALQMRVGEVAL